MTVKLQSPPVARVRQQSAPAPAQAPTGPAELWASRHLISVMVKRDLLGRYRGSVVGFLWTIINPLGHLLLYTFLFSVVLKVKFGNDNSVGNFALYLMTGLLPWGMLSESLSRSTAVVLENPNLVKRVVFPLEILPLSLVLSSLFSQITGITILIVVATIFGHAMHPTLLFVPAIMVPQLAFIAGICWLLGSLAVYLPDLRHLMTIGLQAWMYTTPVIYPASSLPAKVKFLMWINPMSGIVTDYRHVILEGQPPDWPIYAAYTATGMLMLVFGYYFFRKTKRSFADVM